MNKLTAEQKLTATLSQEQKEEYQAITDFMVNAIIDNATIVKKAFYYLLANKFSPDVQTIITVDDLYSMVYLQMIENPMRTGKRFYNWNWNIEDATKENGLTLYKKVNPNGFKRLAIDCIVREQRYIKLCRGQVTENWMKLKNEKIDYSELIESESIQENGTTYLPYIPETGGIHESESWDIRGVKKITDIRNMGTKSFTNESDFMLLLRESLSNKEYQIISLHLQGYTIAEISQQMGKACQYALSKIKGKIYNLIKDDISENVIDSKVTNIARELHDSLNSRKIKIAPRKQKIQRFIVAGNVVTRLQK